MEEKTDQIKIGTRESNVEKLPKIELDIYKDAINYWVACSHKSLQSVDWTANMDSEVVSEISGKTEEEANTFLIPYLRQLHQEKAAEIEQFREFVANEFKEKFKAGCEKLCAVMSGHELYRDEFTLFITTIGRQPYNKEFGWVWLGMKNSDPMRTFLHELCHFQFIHYWQENKDSPVSKLSPEDFNYLKESLTIILDEDFMPIIVSPDKGYEIHKEFRAVLKEFWDKNKDFNALVEYGLKRLPEFKQILSQS